MQSEATRALEIRDTFNNFGNKPEAKTGARAP